MCLRRLSVTVLVALFALEAVAAPAAPVLVSSFDRSNSELLENAFKDETIVTKPAKRPLAPVQQARLSYQAASKQFIAGQNRANVIARMKKQQNLPVVLQRKVKLMSLIYSIETGPDAERSKNIASLRGMLPSLNSSERPLATYVMQRGGERVAIQQWQSGKHSVAATEYARLAKQFDGKPQATSFDRRLVDIRQSEYMKSNDPKVYEQLLLRMQQKYGAAVAEEGKAESSDAMTKFVNSRYQSLVNREVQIAKSNKADATQRQRTIGMLQRQMDKLQDEQRANVLETQADIYALVPNHRKASEIYLDLGLNSKSAKTPVYLQKAINSQSVLASWSSTAPWDGYKPGSRNDRLSLLETYKKLNEHKAQQTNWQLVAQIGWLEIALGQPQSAFEIWQATLNKSTRGNDAAQAAGYMLTAYQRAKRWDDLESLSRLCMSKNIAARFQRQPLALNSLLALSLFEGGKQAHGAQEYAKASAKLKEFTTNYRQDGRRAEGLYILASAYRGDAKHVESTDTLMALVNEYPSSPFTRNALYNGGEWSIAMANEEQAIYFYQAFVTRFSTDKQAPQVRNTLAELYMGRALYAQAATVYREQMQARNASKEDISLAASAILDIETRHGSDERANANAERMLKMPLNDGEKAEAYAVRARYLEKTKNYKGLDVLEAQVEKIASGAEELQDVLGEIRFMQAQRHAKTANAEFFNLALRDPMKTLNEKNDIFLRAQRSYEQVCDAGKTSYCAPAMHFLARMAEGMLGNIEDLSIAETLDGPIVNRFNARKREIVTNLVRTAEKADDRALMAANSGRTSPDWTTQILWNNTSDFTFDRIAGETGNSYIQWAPTTVRQAVEE